MNAQKEKRSVNIFLYLYITPTKRSTLPFTFAKNYNFSKLSEEMMHFLTLEKNILK